MSKSINDLRESLFMTLDEFRKGSRTADDVKAICEISQVIINTAKVEVDYIKTNGGGELDFLDLKVKQSLPNGVVGVTRHKLR